ncbi:MAG: hypothetical protein JRS35_28455 [Deltaproteobacteria bacterium]|nr:hypothetical protein [Deltaproteobacteria bacterium]
MEHREGKLLFEDRFDGRSTGEWAIAPISLIEDPEQGRVLHLKEGDPNAAPWLGWAGDDTWKNYRLELEVQPVGEGSGFLGFDFHVQSDESCCCNVHFPAFPEGGKRVFEGCGRYDDANTSWKLGPLSQRTAPGAAGEWLRLRLDAGETVANLYAGDVPEPVFTIYDLPFASGGIRLWRYYASAYLRNLRVTALNDVEPILDDTWGSVLDPGVIRVWSVSRMLPQGFGADDPVAASRSGEMGWRDVSSDRRGVVNVVGIDPSEYCKKGVVFAKVLVGSPESVARQLRLTYTDQLSMWLNGARVFMGERRGWNDPGRSDADGWGRLMPDQFGVELPLVPGENEILVRLEVNEPLFGSGFWVKML